jgi:GTP-binding protein of the ras superfamily involved in termination of M-phase
VVGTKFDEFLLQSPEYQAAVTDKARRLAAAMSAPLVFCSSASAINIKVIFKIIIIKAFGLQSTITERRLVGEPIVEYK